MYAVDCRLVVLFSPYMATAYTSSVRSGPTTILLKNDWTSVVELYFSGNTVATQTYQYFQTFTIIAVIYFVLTFTVTRILRFIERRMDMDTYTTGANQMQTEDLK